VERKRSFSLVIHKRLVTLTTFSVAGSIAASLLLVTSDRLFAQGGGNANAIGLSIQDSANSAAAAQNGSVGSPPGLSGMPTSADGMIDPSMGPAGPDSTFTEEMAGMEMNADGHYGMPSGNGVSRGQMTVQGMLTSTGGMFLSGIAEFLNRPLSPDAVAFKPSLVEQAAIAMHYGDQRRALALFHAHLIAERESSSQGLDQIRYNPLARQPAWAVRVAVSLHPRIADSLLDDPQPIREDDVATMPNMRQPGDQYGAAPRTRPGQRRGPMTDGGEPMAGFAGEPAAAGFGETMPGSEGINGEDAMMMPGGEQRSSKPAPMVNPAVAAAANAEQTLDTSLGMITALLKSELSARFSAGKFGSVLPDLAARGQVLAEKASQSGTSFPSGASNSVRMWVPGVDFIGTGDVNSMIQKCRENSIDVLLHFDVIVKETRAEPQYDARCRLINCASGENIAVSKAINKRDVLLAARKRGNAAVIAELMQPVFEGLDAKVVAMAMPPLQPQHAISRIDALLAKPNVTQPDVLAELVVFHHKQLIDDKQFEQAMFFAAGEDGLRLLYGAPEERAELADRLVRQQLGLD
jgi:hypothetical protein